MVIYSQVNPKTTPLILVMFNLACAIIPAVVAAPAAIAQQEDTSLGEEDLAGGIVSDVLDGGDEDDEENGDAAADTENDQDSTNTATVNPNQDQIVDQGSTNTFGDNTADLTADLLAANVAIPIAIPISVEQEQPECPIGFTLNNNNGQCERTITQPPECPTIGDFPSTFNPATDLCEASAPFACEAGTFDPATDLCQPVGIPPSCPVEGDFEFNPATDLCEASTAPICTAGTFNPATDLCEQRQTLAPT
jgi:hypothetical protein